MKKSDYHLFQAAEDASHNANYSGANAVQIGCVIAYKGTILAKGYNSDKTHPVQKQFNQYRFEDNGPKYLPPKAHSELTALNKIKYLDIDFSKVRLYVYRAYKDGRPALARPCPACIAYARALGVKHLFYTTNDGYCEEELC